MLIGRKTFGLGGAILAGLLVCASPAQALVRVDANGQVTRGHVVYAKETVAAAATVSGETWYVVQVPASGTGSGRLALLHPLGRRLFDGQSATITYTLTNMQFHGSDSPTLEVIADGSSAAVNATLASGGGSGSETAVFTVTADSSSGTIDQPRQLRLVIRALRVDPATAGNIRVQVNKESQADSNPDWTLPGVVRVRKTGVLRESVSPVSAVAAFGTGFRNFVSGDSVRSDRLAASVGKLIFSVRDGTYYVASSGAPVTGLSDLFSSGAIAYRGDFSFASSVFLSQEADCSATGDDRINLNGDANMRTASVADANEKHLCIEVSGTTRIPDVAGYTASVAYTGVTGTPPAAPGDATLGLGGIGMGGSVVNVPYANLNAPTYIHRLQVYNQSNEAAAYRINFLPPAGTTANPPSVEGSFAPGNTSLVISDLTKLSSKTRTAFTLSVDAPPDLLQVQTILRAQDGSTDTVVYTPE